jgi:hypothetical protein
MSIDLDRVPGVDLADFVLSQEGSRKIQVVSQSSHHDRSASESCFASSKL